MSISQVGAWKPGTVTSVTFDSTPVSGQLLVVKLNLLRSATAPTFTLPTGWHQDAKVEASPSSNFVDTYVLRRQASEDGVSANDTFTVSTNASNCVWESSRWTGHDTTAPFRAATSGVTNTGLNAQTTTDTSVTPAVDGIAFACVGYRLSTQTLTSFGGGFATSENHSGVTGPGAIGTQTVTGGTPVQASVSSGGPSAGTVACNLVTVLYAVAGAAPPPAGITRKVRAAGAAVISTLQRRVLGVATSVTRKRRVGGSPV